MDHSQFDIFQVPNDYENDIFNKAKLLKTTVQQAYDLMRFSESSSKLFNEFAVINFKVSVEHVREMEKMVEPSSPKMFIWQFIPSVILDCDGNKTVIIAEKDSLKNIKPKIIPKWINSFFTTNSFSQNDFSQLAMQYYTLELIVSILLDESLLAEIKKLIGGRKLIFYAGCKLFASKKAESTSIFERDLSNKLLNFYNKLKYPVYENFYFIGYYQDFTKESEFLTQLDRHEYIIEKKKKIFEQPIGYNEISSIYQNDYLFLNNSEFFNSKVNTDNWNSNFIVSPSVINVKFDDFDFSNFDEKENSPKEIFFYVKSEGGDSFVRHDVLFPKIIEDRSELENILHIAQRLKNE